MTQQATRFRWDELELEKVTEMVARKVIAGAETTLTQAYFKRGTLVPLHVHPTEILLYVLQGAVRVQLGTEEQVVREGEVLIVAPGRPHQAECLDDTFVLLVEPRGVRKPAEMSSHSSVTPIRGQ
jgi:quercetin dioxygenase-like cupin family protein